MWSDGLAYQFLNRFIEAVTATLQKMQNAQVDLNFFCISHEKGPVHGTRGSVKQHTIHFNIWKKVSIMQVHPHKCRARAFSRDACGDMLGVAVQN